MEQLNPHQGLTPLLPLWISKHNHPYAVDENEELKWEGVVCFSGITFQGVPFQQIEIQLPHYVAISGTLVLCNSVLSLSQIWCFDAYFFICIIV